MPIIPLQNIALGKTAPFYTKYSASAQSHHHQQSSLLLQHITSNSRRSHFLSMCRYELAQIPQCRHCSRRTQYLSLGQLKMATSLRHQGSCTSRNFRAHDRLHNRINRFEHVQYGEKFTSWQSTSVTDSHHCNGAPSPCCATRC